MADAAGLVEKIKRAAIEAQEATKPVNVYFGKVVSGSPLEIDVEQKMTLGEKQLILTRNVTDFVTTVSENKKDGTNEMTDERQITIRNGLDVGDSVILIRQQEGQRFIVIDRTGGGA